MWAGVGQASREETAEWTDAARALSVYGDEGGSHSAVPQDVEANLGRDGLERGFEALSAMLWRCREQRQGLPGAARASVSCWRPLPESRQSD
jgi:hypothetical protein